jgi:hypothetical protein
MEVPQSFLYWCEMLQRLAPRQHDWEALTGQIASVAYGISYLYNDARAPEWEAAERLIRDAIPATTSYLMSRIIEQKPKQNLSKRQLCADTILSSREFYREFKRLEEERVIVRAGYKYKLGHVDWRELLDREKKILL